MWPFKKKEEEKKPLEWSTCPLPKSSKALALEFKGVEIIKQKALLRVEELSVQSKILVKVSTDNPRRRREVLEQSGALHADFNEQMKTIDTADARLKVIADAYTEAQED